MDRLPLSRHPHRFELYVNLLLVMLLVLTLVPAGVTGAIEAVVSGVAIW